MGNAFADVERRTPVNVASVTSAPFQNSIERNVAILSIMRAATLLRGLIPSPRAHVSIATVDTADLTREGAKSGTIENFMTDHHKSQSTAT